MYLAIDIGGTKTLLAVFDSQGKIVFEHKEPTDKNFEDFIRNIGSAINTLPQKDQLTDCACASPGIIDRKNGLVLSRGNLNWHNVALRAGLEKVLGGLPVIIENDAKAAGLSEAILCQNKYKKVIYLTISTGIGGAVITNGKISPDFLEFEPGKMMLEHDGKIQQWEDFGSGRSLHERYGKLAADIDDPAIWQAYVKDLASAIQQLLAVIQPEVVIVGGGVGAHFEKFSAPLEQELKKLESPIVKIPPIIKAERPEEAVVYGCYELIRQQV